MKIYLRRVGFFPRVRTRVLSSGSQTRVPSQTGNHSFSLRMRVYGLPSGHSVAVPC